MLCWGNGQPGRRLERHPLGCGTLEPRGSGAPPTIPPESVPLRRSLCSPIFLWSLLTMGMTQLRIIFYMAAMNKMLEYVVTGGQEHGEVLLSPQGLEVWGWKPVHEEREGCTHLGCVYVCVLLR